jgi:hypothetical protein
LLLPVPPLVPPGSDPAQEEEEEEEKEQAAAMGCSSSKLDEEAAVKTCHDRKSFVRKAIAQRDLLASSHVAYVQSLRRVSMGLFYYFAEDEHLHRLQESSCVHRPGSPDKVLVVVNCLRPAGAPVHPVVEQWEPTDEAIEAATIDGFFGADGPFLRPPSIDPMFGPSVSPQPRRWDLFWDPFSSLTDHPSYSVEEVRDDQEDEQIPELEEESDGGGGDCHREGEGGAEEEEGEQAAVAAQVAAPSREQVGRKVDHVSNELRVLASAEIEQHGAPGFTVYVDRPPASMAEAVRDIQGHLMKILDTAKEASVLLEVVPYQRRGKRSVSDSDIASTLRSFPLTTALFYLDSSTTCPEGRRRGAGRPRGPAGAVRAVPEPQGEP